MEKRPQKTEYALIFASLIVAMATESAIPGIFVFKNVSVRFIFKDRKRKKKSKSVIAKGKKGAEKPKSVVAKGRKGAEKPKSVVAKGRKKAGKSKSTTDGADTVGKKRRKS